MRRQYLARSIAVAVMVAYSGCNEHAGAPPVSSSLEEATVKGTVRVRGKTVDNGTIRFNCANIRRPNAAPREARINKDGTYTLKTLLGENNVEVECKELHTPKNARFLENDYFVRVETGENTFNIDIPPTSPAQSSEIPSQSRRSPR
jgi:hypothetical protein